MFRPFAACVCAMTLAAALSAQTRGEPDGRSSAALPDDAAARRPRTIRTLRLTSEAMNSVRTYGLLLPPDYDTSARRYPVIYLLHGSGQQHATWGRRTLLDGATGAIVVMPDMDRTRYATAGGRVDPQADAFVTQ